VTAREIYLRVLKIIDYFLKNAVHLSISDLKEHDPSIEELAHDVRQLSNILRALASSSYDDENMAINALQCCFEMEKLAKIVQIGSDSELEDVFRRLEMHTKVP